MIKTVGQLRAALKEYGDDNPIIIVSGGGALAEQMFPIESVGNTPGEVCINLGPEFEEDGSYRRAS